MYDAPPPSRIGVPCFFPVCPQTWTLGVPLLVMAFYLARNQQWVWICSFKILAKPALIYWDNAGGEDSVNVVVPQRGTGAAWFWGIETPCRGTRWALLGC